MFHRCNTEKDSKELFRRLCKHLHPDQGGDHESFIFLKECYDMFLECLKIGDKEETHAPKKPAGNPSKYENSEFDIVADDARLEIFDEIRKYAESHKKFKLSFTDSVYEYLEENGFITASQYNKLVNIYYSFRMDK